jgi:hypothetical protein
MATKRPADDPTVEREDEIRHPTREGDIDEIGAVGSDGDRDLDDEDDDAFEDDDQTDDDEMEDEDVG